MGNMRLLLFLAALLVVVPAAGVPRGATVAPAAEIVPGLRINATYDAVAAMRDAQRELEHAGQGWADYVVARVGMVEATALTGREARYLPALPRGFVQIAAYYRATWVAPRPPYATAVWLAGILVHEATHHQQFLEGRNHWDCVAEREAVNVQIRFLRDHGTSESLSLIPVVEQTLRQMCS